MIGGPYLIQIKRGEDSWETVLDSFNCAKLHSDLASFRKHFGPQNVRLTGPDYRGCDELPPIPTCAVRAMMTDGVLVLMRMTTEDAAELTQKSDCLKFYDTDRRVVHVFPPATHHVKYFEVEMSE